MVRQNAVSRRSSTKFAVYAWGVLAFNLLVVLWGAFVRATGSGAGCGNHWPTCNGDVVPRAPQLATLIEFTHRVTSGIALIAIVGPGGVGVSRLSSRPSGAYWVRCCRRVFILSEALIGAGLVLFEHVAKNASTCAGILALDPPGEHVHAAGR